MKNKFRLKLDDKSVDLNAFKNDALKKGVEDSLRGGKRPWTDVWSDAWSEMWGESPVLAQV